MNISATTVAVSGSKGFVGREVVRRLRNLGASIIELNQRDGVDVTDWSQMRSIGRFTVFVHLAARTFVPQSFIDPRGTMNVNVLGTLNALEACRHQSAKMIFASTYVYGEPRHLPVSEEHPVSPMNPYTESKVVGERICLSYFRDFGIRSTILRAFNIYGPGQESRFLIPSIIEQAKKGEIVLQDGRPRRDFVHVNDVAEAYVRAVMTETDGCEVFNIGSGVSHATSEIADQLRNLVNRNSKIVFMNATRKGEIFETVADIRKAQKILSWMPVIPLRTGLEDCVRDVGSNRV